MQQEPFNSVMIQRVLAKETVMDFLAIEDVSKRKAILNLLDTAVASAKRARQTANAADCNIALADLKILSVGLIEAGFNHYQPYLGDKIRDIESARENPLSTLPSDLAIIAGELREANELGYVPRRGTEWVKRTLRTVGHDQDTPSLPPR